ncbi:MAG: gas vesicle protein [Gemmataceae bacterium]|nr:gas vesicle protein [Gemmataceae bacterium]
MAGQAKMTHAVQSATLADVIERILDKGLVIAGDIKIKLVDIELLSIQIRLLVASVDKAKEIGLDWWTNNSFLNPKAPPALEAEQELAALRERVRVLEAALPIAPPAGAAP